MAGKFRGGFAFKPRQQRGIAPHVPTPPQVAAQLPDGATRTELEQRISAATIQAQDALAAFLSGLGPGYRLMPIEGA